MTRDSHLTYQLQVLVEVVVLLAGAASAVPEAVLGLQPVLALGHQHRGEGCRLNLAVDGVLATRKIAKIWGRNSIADQFSLSFLYLHLVVVVEGLLHLAVIAAESIKLVAGHCCWLLGQC